MISDKMLMAIDLINDYLIYEFGDDSEITESDDLSDISLAYTTYEDPEHYHEIQISVDLINQDFITYIDGKVWKSKHYKSLDSLMNSVLKDLDYDDLVSDAYSYIESMYDYE